MAFRPKAPKRLVIGSLETMGRYNYHKIVEFTVEFYLHNMVNRKLVEIIFSEIARKLKQHCGIKLTKQHYSNTSTSVILSERLYLKIECTGESPNFPKETSQAYSIFQKDFVKIVLEEIGNHIDRPWLSFKRGYAYPRYFTSAHENVKIGNIKIGTLVSRSNFIGHLARDVREVNFLHDKRKIVIDDQLEIQYSSFKNILVYGKEWVIQVSHPPIIYSTKETKFSRFSVNPFILGRCNAILLNFENEYEANQILSRVYYCCQNFSLKIIYVCFKARAQKVPDNLLKFDFGSFEINYLVEAILRRSYALELQGFDAFRVTVKNLLLKNAKVLTEALKELIYSMDAGSVFQFASFLEKSFELKINNQVASILEIIPEKTKLVRRAVITPTRILLYPPELIITNRVVRKFHIDSYLRVSFRDDSLNKFSQSSGRYIRRDVISKTVNSIVDGIKIAKRKFEFLGWSSSQIRDHGLWMYAKDPHGNAAVSIQRWMGDFSNIKVVAKFAARMGQCFSQTEETVFVPLIEGRVKTEEDIVGSEIDPESKEPYVFSDGVGKISTDLARKVCERLELAKPCSAFQIRYSGYKGMLVVDPTVKDFDIVFRESMKKFECASSQTLEIVKTSQACNLTLNRPFITILDQMEINHSVFLKIQNETLQYYTDMLLDDEKAVDYLRMHRNMPNIQFDEFITSGIFPTVEPFFHAMLLTGHKFEIAQIMKKARIPINPSDGRNMFGVLDETGTLNYGEVFIQYTTDLIGQETNLETTIVKGKVLVTKNPCYQPGDVRVLNAIDVPGLHHIVDCIVFPQKGKRPHPNEMSGSDLDGDEYAVIWNDKFIFKGSNARPRHCPVPDKKSIGRDIETSDLLKFFSMFIVNDRIGPLASAHLATADSLGLRHELCTLLARNCSVAVDFSKSGVAQELEDTINVKWYPDFMEKFDKTTYKSKRVLGKLYRNCLAYSRTISDVLNNYENIQVDPLLIYPGWEKYESQAIESRNKYNSLLDSIFINYGVIRESEAMTGLYTKLNGRFSVKNGQNEAEALIKILIQSLWRCFKHDFDAEFSTETIVNVDEIKKKASAWYVVTYREKNPKFLSFPWIVSKYLLNIKYENVSQKKIRLSEKPLINELERLVELELAPVLSVKDSVVDRARILVQKWASYHKFNPNEVLKLLSAVILSNTACSESIRLVLEFFKYVVDISMRDEVGIIEELNSRNCNINWKSIEYVAREARHSYQHVAIKKDLKPFGLSPSRSNIKPNLVEMEPISVSEDVIEFSNLNDLSNFLKVRSRVKEVKTRLEGGKILISAIGEATAIENLQQMIRNGCNWIKKSLGPQCLVLRINSP